MGVKVTPEEKDRERGRERLDQLACPHTLRRTATATAARLNATKQGQEVEVETVFTHSVTGMRLYADRIVLWNFQRRSRGDSKAFGDAASLSVFRPRP